MRTFLAVLGISLCLPATGWGTPAVNTCPEGTLATYIGFGTAGCSVGGLTVSGFSGPAAIGVVPIAGGLRFELDQSVVPVFTGIAPRFYDSPSLMLRIGYTVEGQGITGALMSPEISSDVGSTAIVLATLSNGCEMYSDAHTGFGRPAACRFSVSSRLDVSNEVILRNLNAPDGGEFADSVENTFTATPEPAAWLLMAGSLAALGLLRRRPRRL
jgi:hypothetical protein